MSYIVGDQEYSDAVDHDGDAGHDASTERIDNGDECPTCHGTHNITSEFNMGRSCFVCGSCGQKWFDAVTQPTVDTLTLDMFPDLLMYGDRMEFA